MNNPDTSQIVQSAVGASEGPNQGPEGGKGKPLLGSGAGRLSGGGAIHVEA